MDIATVVQQYNNLNTKYDFTKISSKQKKEYQEIDDLINTINVNDVKQFKSRKCFDVKGGQSTVFLKKELYDFMNTNYDFFKYYGFGEEMNPRTLHSIFYGLYTINKLKDTNKQIFIDIKGFINISRYEKKPLIKQFIDKYTTKTKEIKIDL